MMRIGDVAAALAIRPDTLRYYEKIGLIPRASRTAGGARLYDEHDISRLRFIKRAQKMGFSLATIAELLGFRENPGNAKPQVRVLAQHKLAEIEAHLAELTTLRDELRLLGNLCQADANSCPILDAMESDSPNDT